MKFPFDKHLFKFKYMHFSLLKYALYNPYNDKRPFALSVFALKKFINVISHSFINFSLFDKSVSILNNNGFTSSGLGISYIVQLNIFNIVFILFNK